MIIARLFFALTCGLLLVALYAPYDPWVKHYVGKQFKKAFSQAMDCSFEGEVSSVDIIFPSLTFSDVRIKNSTNDNWYWNCKKYSTGFSWLHLFAVGSIDMWVEITDMKMHTLVIDKSVQIVPHLQRLINPTGVNLPLQFKHFLLHKCDLTLQDLHNNYTINVLCSGEAKRIAEDIKTRFYISEGSCIFKNDKVWHSTTGSLLCDIYKKAENKKEIITKVDLSATIKGSDKEHSCFLSGSWTDKQGRFAFHTTDDVIALDPCIIAHNNDDYFIKCFGRCSLKELVWIATGKAIDINGRCFLNINGPLNSKRTIKIHGAIDHCQYKNVPLTGFLKIEALLKNSLLKGKFLASVPHYTQLNGTGEYDILNGKGSCSLHNSILTQCSYINHWHIKPEDLTLELQYDKEKNSLLTYDCVFSHSTLNKKHHINGTFNNHDTIISLDGYKDKQDSYQALFSFEKYPYIQSILYKNDTTSLLTTSSDDTGVTINCNLLLLRNILASWFDLDIQAEGHMNMLCSFNNQELSAHCSLDKGIIRLPQTYNFIDGGCADITYNWERNALNIHTINGSMHCGTFQINDGTFIFDKGLTPSFIHVPLIFNRCLFNIKRDLFVMLSGHLLFEQKKDSIPAIGGSVIIERGQIKENILSQDFQKQIGLFSKNIFTFSSPVIQTNIDLHTRNGIKIDTPFLKTTARVSLKLADSILHPSVSGCVLLSGGSLQFPYKPLDISRGIITFDPEKGYDPLVELLARNHVRNHRVTLHVTGSLLNHHIVLESTPPLTDEQIISLLLVGSAEESLKNMMPALIMNNLKSLLFGSNQYNFLNKYFRPLGHAVSINLIPSFTDQSGRGGLRGALEISVNDRWRAMIQRSFNFTEDTRVELEYLLADDITLRGLRDERKNIALEAEMRWKF